MGATENKHGNAYPDVTSEDANPASIEGIYRQRYQDLRKRPKNQVFEQARRGEDTHSDNETHRPRPDNFSIVLTTSTVDEIVPGNMYRHAQVNGVQQPYKTGLKQL